MTPLHRFHRDLLDAYGPQGWWPLSEHAGTNPTKTGSTHGYHPGDYTFPRTAQERFEICTGAVLTQNTAWPNVEKALRALIQADALSPSAMLAAIEIDLAALIRPSGYHNAKARKLKHLAAFFRELDGKTPSRDQLLAVWGIGPETADSIRLYAYGQTEMVVDAYTRRILEQAGWIPPKTGYDELKRFCMEGLPGDTHMYQEFHALMVEHAKRLKKRGKEAWSRPEPVLVTP